MEIKFKLIKHQLLKISSSFKTPTTSSIVPVVKINTNALI